MGLIVTAAPTNVRRSEADWTWWVSLFVLCALLGALMGISFKAQKQIKQLYLPSPNYEGLAQAYSITRKDDEDGKRTIKQLRQQIDQVEQPLSSANVRLTLISQDLQQAKFLAGLTAVTGPGVVVTLNDSKKRFPDAPDVQMNFMIHDTDINTVVNELKAGGAEAVSVNDERVVATTPIRCAGPTVFVNNTPQAPPYLIQAIGPPSTLETALKTPGGVYDQISNLDPAMIAVRTADKLMLPAYTGPTQPLYAKAVEDSK
jgi:uncharacterized protein YlxW (UPF0749 family)